MQITVKKDKETKNTVRFLNEENGVSVTLYVQKDNDLSKKDELTVTVES
jgi:hypothetical protein